MHENLYDNFRLAQQTMYFVRRVKQNHPELWKKIQEEAREAEAMKKAAAEAAVKL